jgi:dethiobiotin synthetase
MGDASHIDYASFWVTGTDTDVGKTIVSSLLVTAFGSSYWKPVQSGILTGTDTDYVREVTELTQDHFIPEVYRLTQPLSPHLSSQIDHVEISLDAFHRPDSSLIKNKVLIIEGAGGVMVPLNSRYFVIDLIKKIPAPVILVCRSALGTINHTLLSIEALRSRGIPIHGFIMNGAINHDNERAVVEYGNVRHLGSVPHLNCVDSLTLRRTWEEQGFKEQFLL